MANSNVPERLNNFVVQRKQDVAPMKQPWFATFVCVSCTVALFVSFLIWHPSGDIQGLLALFAVLAGVEVLRSGRVKPKTPEDLKRIQAQSVADDLAKLIAQRKLHRMIHPGVLAVLDEAAGFWNRVQTTLNTSVWDKGDVPAHWKALREQSLRASNQAMDEAMLIAAKSLSQTPRPYSLGEAFGDFLNEFGVSVDLKKPHAEPLPPTFGPMRHLAEQLRALASETESVTDQLTRETPHERGAPEEIQDILSQLRAIRQAESELDQQA